MRFTLLLLLTCTLLSACVDRMMAMSPEEREYRLAVSQMMMNQGNAMMNFGLSVTTPAVNRYYAPPGTVVVPR